METAPSVQFEETAFAGHLMNQSATWSLCIGRWRGLDVRLHVMVPLAVLTSLFLVYRPRGFDLRTVTYALVVLIGSVALHELVRVLAAIRLGGHVKSIVLGPLGGLTKLHLPADPPAHLITALAGPMVFLVLLVVAGCGLALGGDRDVLRLLMNPCAPEIHVPRFGNDITRLDLFAQLVVWVNWWLFIISLMPIEPCAGADLLRGILWPVVGRNTAATATAHVALGSAVFAAMLALVVSRLPLEETRVPMWYPLAVMSIFLLFGGLRNTNSKRYDVGLAIDEFDSDNDDWLFSEWEEEDREAVLVEHLQDKQQEALDRKRREQEMSEDARVDAILAHLHESGFENLSEEERAILKRASRRYRMRRGSTEPSSGV